MSREGARIVITFDSEGAPQVVRDTNTVGNAIDKTNRKGNGFLKGAFSTMTGFLGANIITGLGGQIKGLAGFFLGANASAETFRNQLNIATGSVDKANAVFADMQSLAASSPFEFPELVQGAANLEALGQSSQKWMPIIGNTAAATNHSIDQTVQAVLDAQTGEFERLKEFGIRTKVEGDKVVFSFMRNGQMMTVEAENTQEGISNALMGIWDENYDGAMERMANTFTGRLSTLTDNIKLIVQGWTKPLFDFVSNAMAVANTFFDFYNTGIKNNLSPLASFLRAIEFMIVAAFGRKAGDQFKAFIADVSRVVGVVGKVASIIGTVIGTAIGFITDHFSTLAPMIAGAVAGFAAFSAVAGIISAVTGALASLALAGGPVAAVLALINLPLLITIGLFAAFGLAYQKNFLGFRDAVNKAAKAIVAFGKAALPVLKLIASIVGDYIGRAISAVIRFASQFKGAFQAVGDAIRTAAGWIRDHLGQIVQAFMFLTGPIGIIILAIVKHWRSLVDAFKADGIVGALKALGRAILTEFAGVLDSVTAIVDAIRNVDWGGFLAGAWNAIKTGLQFAWDAITSLNWGDWINPLSWADWIFGKIADLGSWLWEKISSFFPSASVITGAIGSFGTWLWGKISSFFPSTSVITSTVGSFGLWLWGKISARFPAASLITGTIGDIATWIWGKISSYFPSSSLITGSIADFGGWLWEKIGAPTLSFPSKDEILEAIINAMLPGSPVGGGDNSEASIGNPSTEAKSDTNRIVNTSGAPVPSGGKGWNLPAMGPNPEFAKAFRDALAASAAMRSQIPADFSALKSASDSSLVPIGRLFTETPRTWQQPISTTLAGIKSRFSADLAPLAPNTSAIFGSIRSGAVSNTEGMSSGVASKFGDMNVRTSAQTAAMSAGTVIKMGFMRAGVSGATSGMVSTSSTHFGQMVSRSATGSGQMSNAWTNGARQSSSGVRGALGTIPGIVSGIGGSAAGAARAAGGNISAAFAQGMRSRLGEIRAAANAMVAEAERAIRARAMIASPSRLAMRLAEFFTDGWINQLWAGAGDSYDAGAGLVAAAAGGARGSLQTGLAFSGAASGLSGAGNGPRELHIHGDINLNVSVERLKQLFELGEFVEELEHASEIQGSK